MVKESRERDRPVPSVSPSRLASSFRLPRQPDRPPSPLSPLPPEWVHRRKNTIFNTGAPRGHALVYQSVCTPRSFDESAVRTFDSRLHSPALPPPRSSSGPSSRNTRFLLSVRCKMMNLLHLDDGCACLLSFGFLLGLLGVLLSVRGGLLCLLLLLALLGDLSTHLQSVIITGNVMFRSLHSSQPYITPVT